MLAKSMVSPSAITIDDVKLALERFLVPGIILKIPVECFTSSNELLFIGTKTGEIRIIQLETQLEGTLEGHLEKVSCLKLIKQNNYLVSGSYDGSARVWLIEERKQIALVEFHSQISCIEITPDNYYIGIGTNEGKLHIWNYEKNQYWDLEGHIAKIKSIQATPDNKTFISCSEDGTIRLWNIEDKVLIKLIEDIEFPSKFKLTHSGKIFVAVATDVDLSFWSIEESKQLEKIEAHSQQINCLEITNDDKRVVTGSNDASIKVFLIETKKLEFALEGHLGEVQTLAISSDDRYVVSGSADFTIKVWDLNKKEQVHALDGVEAICWNLKMTENRNYIISALTDESLRVWHLDERKPNGVLKGHESEIKQIKITRDSKFLISGSGDKTIRIWNVEEQREVNTLRGHGEEISCMQLSCDDQYIISGSKDESVRVWNMGGKFKENVIKRDGVKFLHLQITLDNYYIVTADSEHKVRIWSLDEDSGFEFVLEGHTDLINDLQVTTDSQYIVTGSRDNTLRIWSIEEKRCRAILEGHTDHVFCLQISKDNKYIVSGANDTNLIIWNINSGEKIAVLEGHKNELRCLAITSDNKIIISGSNDKTIRLWSFVDKRQISVLRGHEDRISCLELSKDNNFIYSGAFDSTVRIWNIKERRQEAVLKGHHYPINCLKISNDGTYLASGSKDKTIRIWTINEIIITNNDQKQTKQIKFYGNGTGIDNQIYCKKLSTGEHPDETMVNTLIYPLKINILHYYCYYDLVDDLTKALALNCAIFKDIYGKSPLRYAIERKSRRSLNLILRYIIGIKNDIILEQFMHGIRDDIVPLFGSYSELLLPFLFAMFKKSEDKDLIAFARPRSKLPIIIFSPSIVPYYPDFVYGPKENIFVPEVLIQYWASPLSWNFSNGSKDSLKFLIGVHQCPNIDIYRTPLIRWLIRLKWKEMKYFTISFTMIFYFNLAAHAIILDSPSIPIYIIFWFINFLLFSYEVFQLYSLRLVYFEDVWNYHDIVRLALCFTWSILDIQGYKYDVLTFLTVISNFLRGIHYFRAFDKTRFYVRLVFRAAYDTVYFLFILLYSTFAFGVLYASAKSHDVEIEKSWKISYELDMGYFSNDGYDGLQYLCFSLASILNVILIGNLLISVLGDSFKKFQRSAEALDFKEMLDVVIEFESLMFWKRKSGQRTYLQMCDFYQQNEKPEAAGKFAQQQGNKIEIFKNDVIESFREKTSSLEEKLTDKITEKINALDMKFYSLETKIKENEEKMAAQEERLNKKLEAILEILNKK